MLRIILVFLCLIQVQATPARGSTGDISLKIGCISASDQMQNPEEGVLTLVFSNSTSRPEKVKLSVGVHAHQKGQRVLFEDTAEPRTSVFSTTTYEWQDREGKAILAGSYKSQGLLQVQPRSTESLYVPIRLPVKSGRYTLKVHFANDKLFNADFGGAMDPQAQYISKTVSATVLVGHRTNN